MGDGGAYLLGFTLAELAILLIYRNPNVSPWAVFSLLAYPVFETVFSMVRRKFIHKAKTGQPDALHLHQLIFVKILRGHVTTNPNEMTKKNSSVAPFIWIPASINAILVLCFWQSTAVLLPLSIAGCVLYVIVYYKLISLPD
jgi:UDP-N-acetylmuramyl pentapeptide phosphotransferase/UDP-N-acetylglucosamine-1-phosphate transferase